MAPRVTKPKGNLSVVPKGDDAPSDPKHNSRAIDEAEAAQLTSIINLLAPLRRKQEETAAAKKEADKAVASHFRHAKAAGFLREEIEAYEKDLNSTAKDLVEAETRRHKHRTALGLPIYDPGDAIFGAALSPDTDEAVYRKDGYLAGFSGRDRKPVNTLIGDDLQDWMAGYDDGQTILALRLGQAKDIPPPNPKTAPKPDEKADPDAWAQRDIEDGDDGESTLP